MGGFGAGGSGYASTAGTGAGAADADGVMDAIDAVSTGLAEDTIADAVVAEGTSSTGDGLGDAHDVIARSRQAVKRWGAFMRNKGTVIIGPKEWVIGEPLMLNVGEPEILPAS